MGTKGLILCVCEGTCPSFQTMNIFEVMNRVRRERLVDWVDLHPQLCSTDGEVFLKVLLKGSDIDKLYIAGCTGHMQWKLFRDAFEEAGFPREKHVGIEIRNLDTDEAFETIKKAIEENP
ncbi:heterodisulfide reductase subunit A [Thermosulfidibacter takaii ABI70S6]|uniref:Heterodisulfide reductase subunit A n=1 Tax=Thermosulfidibacter takaii (strain DSM 17441 / JCM 13301 / NBRC 103674 / ABI70S6) TaxID=1298851 RepID=A0A0S3QVP7_THET7|nr:heterodisulfide reductase subunit A-like protein [Thermosulfidibacter takaii]BAT72395.1 heterodisulfide reductase subunit A [Thermosulfidibacter takaii ABI70S6]